jgi:LuxR family maltose regulon positive regulatory protein
MEYAYPNDILMYFILYLDKIDDLLEDVYKILATSETKIPGEFINKLKLAIERKERREKIHTEDELSLREQDTLKLIAEDLSNQEIADKLFISLNTVKTHLKNIYFKLEVNNRAKAITRAKELELLE